MRMFKVSFFLYSDSNSKMIQSNNSFGRKLENAAREKKKKERVLYNIMARWKYKFQNSFVLRSYGKGIML